MNEMKKIVCGLVAAALVLGSAASALAWIGPDGGGHLSRVVVVGGRVSVGRSVFVGPVGYPYPYPYYYPYPYPATYAAPAAAQQEAPAYAQPATTPQYWY